MRPAKYIRNRRIERGGTTINSVEEHVSYEAITSRRSSNFIAKGERSFRGAKRTGNSLTEDNLRVAKRVHIEQELNTGIGDIDGNDGFHVQMNVDSEELSRGNLNRLTEESEFQEPFSPATNLRRRGIRL